MAVSAPGGQVNPALMGALPPGANHHGHALQHLNPTQQQMLQHQQFQQCTSPHFHHPSLSDWPARQLILLGTDIDLPGSPKQSKYRRGHPTTANASTAATGAPDDGSAGLPE
jgi:hypothetical protein